MSDDEWALDAEPPRRAPVVAIDRRPLRERAKLVDQGLVDFRRVCDQLGILDRKTDTIRSMAESDKNARAVKNS